MPNHIIWSLFHTTVQNVCCLGCVAFAYSVKVGGVREFPEGPMTLSTCPEGTWGWGAGVCVCMQGVGSGAVCGSGIVQGHCSGVCRGRRGPPAPPVPRSPFTVQMRDCILHAVRPALKIRAGERKGTQRTLTPGGVSGQ